MSLDSQLLTLSIDIISNGIAYGMSVKTCHELEKTYFSHIFFEHGFLTYYDTYVHDDFYTQC